MKMGSQRESSLGLRRVLSIVLLAMVLVLPAQSLDTLLCYFCPLQQKGDLCPNVTSHCPPGQRCSSSRGRYGSVHVLSAQGCVDEDLCGSHEITSYQGVRFNVSHACCCRDKCNVPPKSNSVLMTILGIIKDTVAHINVTGVFREEPWDSCANYTSTKSSTFPATAQ